jgi:hypothetical protein
MKESRQQIIDFILKNGWTLVLEEGEYQWQSFYKEENISFDIGDDEIVLIGDIGDFMSINLKNRHAFYTFLGYMLHHRYLAMDYKVVK